MKRILERLKSWAVWVSILGALGVIFNALGIFEELQIDGGAWDNIVTAVGSGLIGFGILNNPTDAKKF